MVNFNSKSDIIFFEIGKFKGDRMAIVKSNICKQCGGLLDIDIDRQVYICPFCGVTFDYEYFRKDNVLDLAKKSIARREFGAAQDAYEYMLKKDPHNFEALRGLILCKCKWNSMLPMLQHNEVHLMPDEPTLINAINNCDSEHKEYFNMIKFALEALKDYRKSKSDLTVIESDKVAARNQLRRLTTAQALNNSKFTNTVSDIAGGIAESGKLAAAVVEIGLLLIVGLGYYTFAYSQYWLPVCLTGIILLFVAIYQINKAITNKALKAAMVPVREELQELEEQSDAKKDECVNYLTTYKTLTSTIVNTFPIKEDGEGKPVIRENSGNEPQKASSDYPRLRKMD